MRYMAALVSFTCYGLSAFPFEDILYYRLNFSIALEFLLCFVEFIEKMDKEFMSIFLTDGTFEFMPKYYYELEFRGILPPPLPTIPVGSR